MRSVSFLPSFTLVLAVFLQSGIFGQTPVFKRGDSNADSSIDISDATFTLRYLFAGGRAPGCEDALDANDDGRIDVSDAVNVLVHLFLGGPEPASPGRICGPDPTPDDLGCERYLPCGHTGTIDELATLRAASECGEVVDALKRQLTESMQETLEQNLALALDLVQFGGCWGRDMFLGAVEDGPPAPAPQGGEGGDGPDEFSETNNQVEGVDEADFVKTDGSYVYVVADGRFQVIDSWPAAEARRIASVDMEGTPRRLFVHGDRAVIFSSLEQITQTPGIDPWFGVPMWTRPGDCTYGYDCELTGDGRKLRVSIFDIADRTAPALLRELDFSGSYLSGRRVGQIVSTVVTFPEVIVPGLKYWPEELEDVWDWCWRVGGDIPFTADEVRAMFERLREHNLTAIADATITDFLPSVTDTRYEGGEPVVREGLLEDCSDFYLAPTPDGRTLLSLISFALDETEDPAATTIVSRPGAVYASRESLYVATRHHVRDLDEWFFPVPERIPEATTVHKFAVSPITPGSVYVGSGVVKGRVLNQFSMDEFDGHLRIATTTGRVPSPSVHSTVSVLRDTSDGLEVVGQVDDIAPTEDIRSVRFNGDVGYIVTFKKTDPLFVLDLSEPTLPAIRGELKIPGFSTYMHILDDEHVLSIGYDANDQGSFAWFQGILLQIFDVGDMENPRLTHREVIGARGSTSDAVTDHLAFTFFRPRGLLGVPIIVCEGGGGGGGFGDRMTFSGLMVYHVDVASGFELLGGVPHADPVEGTEARQLCSSWWTTSNSKVKRSIFMDDFVFSIALDAIKVSHVDDLEHPVATVSLVE